MSHDKYPIRSGKMTRWTAMVRQQVRDNPTARGWIYCSDDKLAEWNEFLKPYPSWEAINPVVCIDPHPDGDAIFTSWDEEPPDDIDERRIEEPLPESCEQCHNTECTWCRPIEEITQPHNEKRE